MLRATGLSGRDSGLVFVQSPGYCAAHLRRAGSQSKRSMRGAMAEDGTSTAHGDVSAEALATAEARRMLDTFASVGATRFEVTWTDLAGDKQHFRR
jgi:hypothetical protein